MPDRNGRAERMAHKTAELVASIYAIWMPDMGSAGGTVPIGCILTEAFYSANQWVSASYVQGRFPAVSEDTVRRRLERMVDAGKAEVMEVGGRKAYRANRACAERTFSLLDAEFTAAVDRENNRRLQSRSQTAATPFPTTVK